MAPRSRLFALAVLTFMVAMVPVTALEEVQASPRAPPCPRDACDPVFDVCTKGCALLPGKVRESCDKVCAQARETCKKTFPPCAHEDVLELHPEEAIR
mmetsp:Transcript_4606/g.11829  ORF Transcript_4606/g.11829 Transcript_4606/m.11829 type:complete len:98 (+) Transcript_4606:56-349(+)